MSNNSTAAMLPVPAFDEPRAPTMREIQESAKETNDAHKILCLSSRVEADLKSIAKRITKPGEPWPTWIREALRNVRELGDEMQQIHPELLK